MAALYYVPTNNVTKAKAAQPLLPDAYEAMFKVYTWTCMCLCICMCVYVCVRKRKRNLIFVGAEMKIRCEEYYIVMNYDCLYHPKLFYHSSVHAVLNFKFYLVANNHFKLLIFGKKLFFNIKVVHTRNFKQFKQCIKVKYLSEKDVFPTFPPWKSLQKKIGKENRYMIIFYWNADV